MKNQKIKKVLKVAGLILLLAVLFVLVHAIFLGLEKYILAPR